MNYPRLFERCYLRPVSITPAAFRSIHAVLRPRISGTVVDNYPEKPAAPARRKATTGRQDVPEPTYGNDGRVIDPRMFNVVGPGVATIAVKGILARNVSYLEATYCGMAGFEPIAEALRQVAASDDIDTLILDIDSPGGECNGTDELCGLIAEVAQAKTVVAFTDGMACSAACQISCAASEIYCTSSAMLGSVGVICACLDDTQALTDEGFRMDYFTAGAHKAVGYSGYTLTDADKLSLQSQVDYCYGMFADFVREHRGEIAPLVNKSAEIYTGQQGVEAGLADAVVSGFDEVVQLVVATRL